MFDWFRNMPLVLLSKHDEQNILHKMTAFGSYIQIPFTYPILADKDFLYNVQQKVTFLKALLHWNISCKTTEYFTTKRNQDFLCY